MSEIGGWGYGGSAQGKNLTSGGGVAVKYRMKQKSPQSTDSAGKIPEPFSKSQTSVLLSPPSGWISLLLCVRSYKARVLASAIESAGILVYDRFDRESVATDGPSSDVFSKSYALDLLAGVAAEERDPGPIPSWEHERWEVEDHPLQRFGWRSESLPDFESIKNSSNGNVGVAVPWTQRSKSEFEVEKNKAGSFEAAGKLHGVSRTRYTKIYNQVTGTATPKAKNKPATEVHFWGQLGARKK